MVSIAMRVNKSECALFAVMVNTVAYALIIISLVSERRTISMGCGALALAISTPTEAALQCALCILC
ncbi:hypothetical protein CK210_11965 [Vibrio anguillarum]|nr:hypothetical protein CKY00_11955 [Vibrio anguillarum]AUB91443.1 hypothetical protein CKX99_11970 [Vibrio anguillarum]AUB94882.1 hypothetical protein CK210_11965 [Vibrio anguillarum]